MQRQDLYLLEQGLADYNITLSDRQAEQFVDYGALLLEWNQKMNLTAITDPVEIAVKHFLDSLTGVRVVAFHQIDNMIDLGTGAGFPGIPLKILFPDLQVVLADSLKKRIGFLNYVIEHLELTNINTVHGRAEDLARKPEFREKFDLCASRAVANLAVLSEYCLPFVKKGGFFLSYKGPGAENELQNAKQAIKVLGGNLKNTDSFTLPPDEGERTLVLIEKIGNTPKKYPRQAGTPAKKPLGV